MSDTWKCNSCGGTYSDRFPDGTAYFHACPPISTDGGATWQKRPGHRDENVLTRGGRFELGITAEGAGVTPVAPTTLSEPRWITSLKARIAKQGE